MNAIKYLTRINFRGIPSVDLDTLFKIHECHVSTIPFENLDIQNKTEIRLDQDHLFNKVVENFRGGFCYELNYLFWFLLTELNFDVRIISAQIFDGEVLGPEFDHMALIIKLNGKNWLADVGFGDLFIRPLDVDNRNDQFDGRNHFKVKKQGEKSFLLSMSKNGIDYESKYLFQIESRKIEEFSQQCQLKQSSPSSYFVKNKIVTLPIYQGRKTIFNSKYIIKTEGNKTELSIENKKEEIKILKKEFNITV